MKDATSQEAHGWEGPCIALCNLLGPCWHRLPSSEALTAMLPPMLMTSLPRAGFLKQFMGVCKPDQTHGHLAAVVRELSRGRAPSRVLCCGHSLGGALATLGERAFGSLPPMSAVAVGLALSAGPVSSAVPGKRDGECPAAAEC